MITNGNTTATWEDLDKTDINGTEHEYGIKIGGEIEKLQKRIQAGWNCRSNIRNTKDRA